jgi:ArsR family transcriptional regulator
MRAEKCDAEKRLARWTTCLLNSKGTEGSPTGLLSVMTKKSQTLNLTVESGADLFGALADPTRLRLASLILHNGEICVCDLMSITGLPQTKISKHLAVLRKVGMVTHRREGTWLHYSMSKTASPLQSALLKVIGDASNSLAELKRDLQTLRKSDCCAPSAKLVQIKL